MIRTLLTATSLVALTACSMTESEIIEAEEAGIAAAEAEQVKEEYDKTQDFDAIAEDAVSGMDTSDLSALE